ncbi:MAG TPA: oligosaccharide flippase family protein [Burkholderiales bacterium]|jgi:O-antigen/teichoic acid export membrane protein
MANEAPYAFSRLKRSLTYFATGKSAAALLALANFTLVVQLLPVREYAAYASILATVELAINFSTFGLDWAGMRYLPELREHGNHAGLLRLMRRLLLYRFASLAAVALIGAAVLHWALGQAQLEAFAPVAKIYLCVMVIDGMLRFILGVAFDSLLLQGYSQVSLLIRNAIFAAVVAAAPAGANIHDVAHADLMAACGALFVAAVLLLSHLRAGSREQAPAKLPPTPDARRMRRMAMHNYLSMLLNLPYSPQALLLLAGWFLPLETTAVLGFARNFTELVRRYQPVEMLLGFVRPLLISTYARGRDFAALTRMSQLIYKISLLTLCPVLVMCTAYGDELIDVLTKHKYPQAYCLVVGLTWTLVLRSHRLLVGTMANILDRPELLTRTSTATLAVVPICAAGFSLGFGPLTMFVSSCVEETLGTWIIVGGMRAQGYAYAPPWTAMLRIALISAGLAGLLAAARLLEPSLVWQAVQVLGAATGVVGLAFACGYFDAPERSTLRSFARRGAA